MKKMIVLLSLLVFLILVALLFITNKYIYRYVFWNFSGIDDYKLFPSQPVKNMEPAFYFTNNKNKENEFASKFKTLQYKFRDKKMEKGFDELLTSTGTTAFIVIKDDTILCEKYYNGYKRDSINTSFSMAKSFTSSLVGIAVDEGYIKSIDDRVVDYIPELKNKISDNLTIKHLINMSSGIRYNPKYYPWADEPKSYYYPDLRELVLRSTKQEYQPGLYFKYSNYNTMLLGIILERTTKRPPYEYLREKIWKPIEMEFPATWSVDSKKTDFAKMDSGINARSIDFAKFGRLFLNNGQWNGKQKISENWIKESTSPFDVADSQYYSLKNYYPYSMFFKDKRIYYKYGWWGLKQKDHYDFMAVGILGQFIYVCPQKRIIIVRNGSKWGEINWWPDIFSYIIDNLE